MYTDPIQAYLATRNALNQLKTESLSNQAAQDKLNYLPQMLAAKQQAQNLGNELQQIAVGFAPRLDQAKLNAAAQEAQLTPIKIALAKQQLALAPQKFQLAQQQLKQQQNRFGAPYQAAKVMEVLPKAERATFIGQQAAPVYGLVTNALNAANVSQQQPGSPATPQIVSTPTDIAQLQSAAQQEANQALTTTATRRQMEGGEQVKSLVNSPQFNQGAKAFSQYAGALGKGKEFYDAWTNSNQAQYNDAMSFRNQMVPLLANRIKTLDGMGATDAQRQEMNHAFMAAFTSPSSDPKRALASINHLKDTINAVEDSVAKSGEKVFQTESYSAPSTNGVGGFSAEEIKAYAKQNGLSVAQVEQMIRERQ